MSDDWLIVGLGNPGERYRATRHNIGFMVLDDIAGRQAAAFSARWDGAYAAFRGRACRIHCLKPMTYMNLSGRSVRACLDFYRLETERLVVVFDDADLAFGRLRLRADGGSGGHRGIESLFDTLGTDRFFRVRVGIRNPVRELADTADFVLSRFSPEEQTALPDVVRRAADAVSTIVDEGFPKAANLFSSKRDPASRTSPADGE